MSYETLTESPPLLSVTQAAAVLGVKRDYVYAAIRNGELPAVYLGTGSRAYARIIQEDLAEFIQSRRIPGGGAQ